MSGVLPAGDKPILFGRLAIPARTQVRTGYLARPGLRGSYPTVVLVPSAHGLSASVRSLCQELARYGLAVLAVDLLRGDDGDDSAMARVTDRRAVGDIADAVAFIGAPQTGWSDPDRIGMLGLGTGGRFAALAAQSDEDVGALAICYTPLGAASGAQPGDSPSRSVQDVLRGVRAPLLGIYGRADEIAAVDEVESARAALPEARWLIYQDAGHDFLDESTDDYDLAAAGDAQRRLVEFFLTELAVSRALEPTS